MEDELDLDSGLELAVEGVMGLGLELGLGSASGLGSAQTPNKLTISGSV
jgi:hypothetical protein